MMTIKKMKMTECVVIEFILRGRAAWRSNGAQMVLKALFHIG